MSWRNTVTVVRLVLLLPLFYLAFAGEWHWFLQLLLLSLLLDVTDEFLQRKVLRSFLHPFADKILVFSLLLFFAWGGLFSWLLLLFLLARDAVVLVVRWLAAQDEVVLREETYRKLLIYSQFLLLFLLAGQQLLDAWWLIELTWLALALTVILAITSMTQHLLVYRKGLRLRKAFGRKLGTENLSLLTNKTSSGYKDSYRRRLLRIFARRRRAQLIELPRHSDMLQGVEKKIPKGSQIMLAGGDGTFESALNYQPFWKRSLGFFPLGAGNIYYSYFYRGKRFEYLRSRFPFREAKLDVLELQWQGGKQQTTLLSAGLDAEVMRLTRKSRHGLVEYGKAGARSILAAKGQFHLKCILDGKQQEFQNCVTLTIGKIPYLGFGLRGLVGKPAPADGLVYGLAVVNTHHPFWNKLIRGWALLFALFNLDKAPFYSFKCKDIRVESHVPFPVQAGGDFLGYTKWLTVKVVRQQKVLVI